MGKSFCVFIIITISVLNSGADEKETNNLYLSLLVENYTKSRKHDFQVISWDDSSIIPWGEQEVLVSFNNQRKTNIDIRDDTSGSVLDIFTLDYEITPFYMHGIFQTKFGNYETLIISHYLVGATGWTANLIIMHLITKTDSGYHHQELSSFFSSIDSFVDLNEDGITEFICIKLILDVDGNFIVPSIFNFSTTGEFRQSTEFKTRPVRLDRSEGLIPISWEEVSKSVKDASEVSEPRAYYHESNKTSSPHKTLKESCR